MICGGKKLTRITTNKSEREPKANWLSRFVLGMTKKDAELFLRPFDLPEEDINSILQQLEVTERAERSAQWMSGDDGGVAPVCKTGPYR